MDRRRLGVDQVHAHLGATPTFDRKAERAHVLEPAALLADRFGDRLGYAHVPRGEVGVEGDQELARAHRGRAGARMDPVRPEVGRSSRVGADRLAQAFEFPAADVGEILSLRP